MVNAFCGYLIIHCEYEWGKDIGRTSGMDGKTFTVRCQFRKIKNRTVGLNVKNELVTTGIITIGQGSVKKLS